MKIEFKDDDNKFLISDVEYGKIVRCCASGQLFMVLDDDEFNTDEVPCVFLNGRAGEIYYLPQKAVVEVLNFRLCLNYVVTKCFLCCIIKA